MNTRLVVVAAAFMAALFSSAAAVASGGGGDAHGAHKRSTGSESFIELQSVTASVVSDFHAQGLFQVELGVDVPDHALHERALILEPRLRAACSEALRTYAGDEYVPGTPPDADRIKALMQEAVDEALGEPGAHVLFSMLVIQGGRR